MLMTKADHWDCRLSLEVVALNLERFLFKQMSEQWWNEAKAKKRLNCLFTFHSFDSYGR